MRRLQIVWGALLMGMIVYTAGGHLLLTSGTVALSVVEGPAFWVLIGVVAVYMGVGLALRALLVGRVAGEQVPERRFERYQTATIIPLAIMESGGLVVITLGVLSGSPTWVLAGGAASAWLMWVARPRLDELRPPSPSTGR